MKRYKVLRDDLNWSLGYPTKASAQAAARRLNHGHRHPRFTAKEMAPVDYKLLTLEEA